MITIKCDICDEEMPYNSNNSGLWICSNCKRASKNYKIN